PMGRIFLISILLLISNLSIGQTKSFLDKPYLETTASADTLVQPDVIYLAILIREKDERNKTSVRSEEHTSELQSRENIVCLLLLRSPPISSFFPYTTLFRSPMGRIFLISILLLISNLSIGQTKSFLDKPYLETTASADTLVQPDVIYLAILIREKDERNKTSVEAMEAKMIEKLMSLGIDLKEQLTLSDLASNFKKYFLKQQDILKDKAYSLKVYDSQTAGRV